MCLFRLLTVASCLPQTEHEVAPVCILLWFLSEPGVVNTFPHTGHGKCCGMADGG